MYAPTITPAETQSVQRNRSTARNNYLRGINQNDFERGQAGIDRTQALQRFGVVWGRTREALPGQFQARGLMNSGIYQGALENYGVDRTMAGNQITNAYDARMGGLGQQRSNLETQFGNDYLGIDLDEQTRRGTIAAALRQVL